MNNFNLKNFLTENKLTVSSNLKNELHEPIDYDFDEEQERIINQIAQDAITIVMEQPGTSALEAIEAVIEGMM